MSHSLKAQPTSPHSDCQTPSPPAPNLTDTLPSQTSLTQVRPNAPLRPPAIHRPPSLSPALDRKRIRQKIRLSPTQEGHQDQRTRGPWRNLRPKTGGSLATFLYHLFPYFVRPPLQHNLNPKLTRQLPFPELNHDVGQKQCTCNPLKQLRPKLGEPFA